MNDSDDSVIQVLLAEFTALRSEILQTMATQWTIVVFQLTVTSIIFSFSLTSYSRTGFLLIVPLIAYILCARYLNNERSLRRLGTYIMDELSPRLPGGLQWEEWLRGQSPPGPAFPWFFPLPVIFPAISAIALAWVLPYILSAKKILVADEYLLWVMWILGIGLLIISLYAIQGLRESVFRQRKLPHARIVDLGGQVESAAPNPVSGRMQKSR